jgi:glucosamine kinase
MSGAVVDFVVGVDGGGTGCRAMLMGLDGEELHVAQGPPALIHPSNPGGAAEAIGQTVGRAVAEAGAVLPAAALWAGLAGAGRPGVREAVEIALRTMGLAKVVGVGMDVEGAHQDAFGQGAGVLVVVGTGSMAWGRDPEGGEIRVGGWGGLLGDEGGGYWMGLQGLRAVARAADGRDEVTLLSDTLLSALDLQAAQDLISWSAKAGKGEVAALAPLVLDTAAQGDPAASLIVNRALDELRLHFRQIRSHWEPWGSPIPMALVGGLMKEGGRLREPVEDLVEEAGGELSPQPVLPVRGAARLALSLL